MWWLIFPAIIVAFLAVVLIRTAAFKPKKPTATEPFDVEVDCDSVTAHLAEMIRCKTVSYYDLDRIDHSEFERFIALLPEFYPELFRVCEFERLHDYGLLLRWKGREAGAPTLLMAHYDVVPVDEAEWEHPPFSGDIVDGVLWGRGTLDTKGTLCCELEAAELMVKRGFTPKKDIFFAFGGDEETGGCIAHFMADTLHERGLDPELVLDEGGAVVNHVFPGVSRPAALIGISEKGFTNITYTAKVPGGHSSTPPAHTGLGVLSQAAVDVEKHPFPRKLSLPAAGMFDTLGRHSTFVYRMIFANLWCFMPLLDMICKNGGGELNALLRTTNAFTQAKGSDAPNVMPGSPTMVCNLRLIPGDTPESALERLRTLAKKLPVELTPGGTNDTMPPSAISEASGEPWERISNAVQQTYPDAIVSPFLMLGGTDAKSYSPYCRHTYRFTGMELTGEERATIHAFNERIQIKNIPKLVSFYARVINNS